MSPLRSPCLRQRSPHQSVNDELMRMAVLIPVRSTGSSNGSPLLRSGGHTSLLTPYLMKK